MNDTSSSTSLLPTLLLVLFVGLKLTGHIDWTWWWVLSPVWISIVVAGMAFGIYMMVVAVRRWK